MLPFAPLMLIRLHVILWFGSALANPLPQAQGSSGATSVSGGAEPTSGGSGASATASPSSGGASSSINTPDVPTRTSTTSNAAASATISPVPNQAPPPGSPPVSVTVYPGGSNGNGKAIIIHGLTNAEAGVDNYLGIPFGEPPTEALRFEHPQPAKYNSDINATTFKPSCAQIPVDDFGGLAGGYGTSEDCLYLNVYTPTGTKPNANLPVVVWVYGGGLYGGAASVYNPQGLMYFAQSWNEPFVFVSISYRLGVLGWGKGEDLAQNGALNNGDRDAKLSLEWVKDNIWAFGGDCSKITIAGESSGAEIIGTLLLDEKNCLFRSAILMSGDPVIFRTSTSQEGKSEIWESFLNSSGCSVPPVGETRYQCLKKAPVDKIINAQLELRNAGVSTDDLFGQAIDGDIIPAAPHELVAQGRFAKIPFIAGNVLDEGTVFVPPLINTTDTLELFLRSIFSDPQVVTRLLELYPDDPSQGSPFGTGSELFGLPSVYKRAAAIIGDLILVSPRRYFSITADKAGAGGKSWAYRFDQQSPATLFPAAFGVFHASELNYMLSGPLAPEANYTLDDIAASLQMMRYWGNFIYTSNPNEYPPLPSTFSNLTLPPPDSPHWPPYYGEQRNIMRIIGNASSVLKDDYREEGIGYLLEQWESYRY